MSPLMRPSRPQSPMTVPDRIDRIIPRVDELARMVRLGHPLTPAQYNDAEAEARAIADELVAMFRRSSRAVAPPLAHSGGRAIW